MPDTTTRAIVGFSANSELVLTYDRITSLEKGDLEFMEVNLGGTSANVATAIQTLGGKSHLLTLTGNEETFETYVLDYVFKKFKIPFTKFPILDKSNISIIPIDGLSPEESKVFCSKGLIREDLIAKTIKEIKKLSNGLRIATGVRLGEIELVKAFFNNRKGYRSLNPRIELIQKRDVFKDIMTHTDIIFLNSSEYEECLVTSPEDLHEYGPHIIVVTAGDKGGMVSLKGHGAERFEACKVYTQPEIPIHTTGAGDWFQGGFHYNFMKMGKSLMELTMEDLLESADFGARVAGKKITMLGAHNGPTASQI